MQAARQAAPKGLPEKETDHETRMSPDKSAKESPTSRNSPTRRRKHSAHDPLLTYEKKERRGTIPAGRVARACASAKILCPEGREHYRTFIPQTQGQIAIHPSQTKVAGISSSHFRRRTCSASRTSQPCGQDVCSVQNLFDESNEPSQKTDWQGFPRL